MQEQIDFRTNKNTWNKCHMTATQLESELRDCEWILKNQVQEIRHHLSIFV